MEGNPFIVCGRFGLDRETVALDQTGHVAVSSACWLGRASIKDGKCPPFLLCIIFAGGNDPRSDIALILSAAGRRYATQLLPCNACYFFRVSSIRSLRYILTMDGVFVAPSMYYCRTETIVCCRLESLPADMQTAFQNGTLLPPALERFLALEANWFFKIFMPLQGVYSAKK